MKEFLRILAIITAWPVQWLFFKKRTFYESDKAKKRVRGGAIIISNHTNLFFDYVLNMFTFAFRKLYCLFAEVLYTHGALLRLILDSMGGIKVDRNSKNMGFIDRAVGLLKRGKLLQIFPEGRLETEGKLLEFKPAYIFIALKSGKPIIPIVTDGNYGLFKRTCVLRGEPIFLSDYYSGDDPTAEDIQRLNDIVRGKFKKLINKLKAQKAKLKQRTTFVDYFLWDMGRLFTFLFNIFFRVKVVNVGKEKNGKIKGKCIIAANHIDLMDPLKMICAFWRRRLKILTADVVFENKRVREFFMTKLGCIKINREKNDVEAVKNCLSALNDDRALLIFPEGHIKTDESDDTFKSGASVIAYMA
ncbi:MAG: 1-acyl-sn-glycerol-3-phosphate acyltransferase, partial [Clostridia bacterium]|nr:1-acyl-sn-glycerol-3-phosphate acyltransferase [Clostridia bacterium]